jgi:hypothetical protein
MGNARNVVDHGSGSRYTVVDVVSAKTVSEDKGPARKAAMIMAIQHGYH